MILMVTENSIWPWQMNSINNVSVLLGNGDGTFLTAVNYDAGTESLLRSGWRFQ